MPSEEIAGFAIKKIGILNSDGDVDETLEPGLPDEALHRLYRAMSLARAVDKRMLNMQRQGRLGTFPPSIGQEAAHCAPILAMEENDWFVGAYRELGARLMRGEPIVNELMLWGGYEEGNIMEPETRTLPVAIVLSSQVPVATGIAYAARFRDESDVAVVCFFSDGATSEGDFHEGLNMAGAWKVPAVFICQNNQWAISTPRKIQTASETLAQKAIAYGIHGVQADGNDALAMYSVTKQALERARKGKGPTLIEAVTYRMSMHTTADDPSRYRTDEEVKKWEKYDPIKRFRKYLENNGKWSESEQTSMEEEIKKQIDDAVSEYESRKDYKPDAPFDVVYGTQYDEIEDQREDFLENMRKDSEDA